MSGWMLIFLGFIALLSFVGIIVTLIVWKRKKEGKMEEPDYQAFYIMGICFLLIGIILMATVSPAFIGFTGIGLFYMAIGLANRDKWKKED